MGNLHTSCCVQTLLSAWATLWRGSKTPPPRYQVLVVGLDAAGKTTLLYKLASASSTQKKQQVETICFPRETYERLHWKSLELLAWDIGGCCLVYPTWHLFLPTADAVIVVVDCADRDRLGEVEVQLKFLCTNGKLRDQVPFLVFANKQDKYGALSPADCWDALKMDQLSTTTRQGKTKMQASNMNTGQGIDEGLQWLTQQLQNQELVDEDVGALCRWTSLY